MVDTVDCVVVGAGVVGLAVARALALQGREVLVLEAADAMGTGTSARNSEVIHAGLYYATGSLKARLCVQGREMLYDYCAERHVPHQRCGKLVVATDAAQLPALQAVQRHAQANGVQLQTGLPDKASGSYQTVLANILATPLRVLAPLLCGHVAPGGHLVLAGILERQAEELQEAYAPWLSLSVADREDGWILMTAMR